MRSKGCDACCGCISLKIGLRIVACVKVAASILFLSLSIFLMMLPGMKGGEPSDSDEEKKKRKEASSLSTPIAGCVALAELTYMILAYILICTAGTPKATRIPCCVMVVVSFVHGVSVVVASFFVDGFYTGFFIGMFVGGAVLTVYMAFITWGLVRQEKKATENPPEAEAAGGEAPPEGSDGNYGGPEVISYPDQSYPDQSYPAQPDRSKSYGIKAARGGGY